MIEKIIKVIESGKEKDFKGNELFSFHNDGLNEIIEKIKELAKNKCKICGNDTINKFNIKFKKINICENCADSIIMQQIEYLIKNKKTI